MAGYNEAELRNLVHQLEQTSIHLNGTPLMTGVRRAFQTKPFIYGTQGKRGGGLRMGGFLSFAMNERNDAKRPKLFSAQERDNFPSNLYLPILTTDPKLKKKLQADKKSWIDKLKNRKNDNAFNDSAKGYSFQSGGRQFQQRRHGYQMMDMYYGDGKNVGDKADPFILEFVNYAAKLKPVPERSAVIGGHNQRGHHPNPGVGHRQLPPGQVSPQANANINPWQAARPNKMHPFFEFDKNNPNDKGSGWKVLPSTTAQYGQDAFRANDMTLTKELSRIIRWCVKEFGGTIIFDGAEVYYDQVFNTYDSKGAVNRFGDTEVEASDLFQYFSPGQSQATFGMGKIIFHWHGQETVPSQLLFLTSWVWDKVASDKWYNLMHEGNFAPGLSEELEGVPFMGSKLVEEPVSRFKKLFGVKPNTKMVPEKQGVLFYLPISDFVEDFVLERKDLWRKFQTLPVGVTDNNDSIMDWINKMKKSDYRTE